MSIPTMFTFEKICNYLLLLIMAPYRLNYTHEDNLNLFIIYGECDKVL